ncbi:MAG: response regulator [Nitrospirota bacterium]
MAKKILVVDSNPALQKLVEYNLSREKFEVICLNNGLSALDLLTEVNPDLILADYHIEEISLTRFCEKVKQKKSTKEYPIIVLIGATDSYDANALVSIGVVGFVKKPLEPKELIEKLKELFQDTATLIERAPKPVAPAQPTAEEQTETMKIEELLGWPLPGGKPTEEVAQKTGNVIPEQDNEMTMIQSRAGRVVPPPPVRPESPKKQPPPAMREDAFPRLYANPETVEAPPSPSPPAEAQVQPAASGAVSQERAEAMVSKIAGEIKEIIEKVAWDVVPSLAEIMIKEELEKLKTDKPS